MALTGNDKTYADIMAAVQGAKDQNSINAARNRLGELNGIGAGDATNTFSSILDKAQQGIDNQTNQVNSIYDNMKNSQLASAQAQRDAQITDLRRKLAEQLPMYQTQRAQADVGQQQNFNALKEYMGNSGAFNSGDNLSRAGNIITQRGNAVNQINGNENAYTIANQNAINDANSAYNVAANQINSQSDAQKAQALMDLQDKLRQENQWQQQFDFNKDQANQSQSNWQATFDYTKASDAQKQAFNQAQFDYQKEQDRINNTYRQGTFEWQKAMDQANLDLQRKQLAISQAKASGGSSGGSSGLSKSDQTAMVNQAWSNFYNEFNDGNAGTWLQQNANDLINYLGASEYNKMMDYVKKNADQQMYAKRTSNYRIAGDGGRMLAE